MPLTDFTWRFIEKLPNRTNKNFIIKSIPKVFVEKELRALRRNKATGLNELPPGLLKDCAAHISGPLCHIINLSIDSGTVPSVWKAAKVTSPIFKSGNHEFPENYRPVSVLPVFSKILEKGVHRQFIDFLESNNLLFESQIHNVHVLLFQSKYTTNKDSSFAFLTRLYLQILRFFILYKDSLIIIIIIITHQYAYIYFSLIIRNISWFLYGIISVSYDVVQYS